MTKLLALGLTETTSIIQRKNGTRRFHDPITKCDYMSYVSGYIRRTYLTIPSGTAKPIHTIYQLNPKQTTNTVLEPYGLPYTFTKRVLIHSETERLDRLAKAVANYRITREKYSPKKYI